MAEVTLSQILQARDDRVARQQALLGAHQSPLISFTMNIAGPIKTSPLIERGFFVGLSALKEKLPKESVLHYEIKQADTGCEALLAVAADAVALKELCIGIEEASPLGRLFDMDVLDHDGHKLPRHSQRGCLVCGAPGRACAAGRTHTVAELQAVTNRILYDHFAAADAVTIADTAVQALIDEVNTTPKPGLVDCRNNGSHNDMTRDTFLASANALRPYFEECVTIGRETAESGHEDAFALLRQAGIRAESAMLTATNGVNTHKGIIFTLGTLCGALGRLWKPNSPFAPLMSVLSECAALTHRAVSDDFSAVSDATAGERLYSQLGLTGVRGEVSTGLPSVATVSLPVYRALLDEGLEKSYAGALTLLHLISRVADTTLYHRGGVEGAQFAADEATALLAANPHPSIAVLEALDDRFIARRLSPGGCADLLAVTYFLHDIYK